MRKTDTEGSCLISFVLFMLVLRSASLRSFFPLLDSGSEEADKKQGSKRGVLHATETTSRNPTRDSCDHVATWHAL